MKKLIAIILILCTVLSLCGCGETAEQGSSLAPNTLAITEDSSVTETSTEQTSSISTVVVPDVIGMDKDEAVKKLEDLGLKVVIAEEPTRDMERADNQVMMQSHAKDTVVVYGAEIELQCNSHELTYKYHENDEGEIYIINVKGFSSSKEIRIPSEYNGKAITRIYLPASFGEEVKQVFIPNTIKNIYFRENTINYELLIDNKKEALKGDIACIDEEEKNMKSKIKYLK